VVVLDRDGRIRQVIKCSEQWSGFATKEPEDRKFWEGFAEAGEMDLARRAFHTALRGELPQRFETWFVPKSGEARRVSWSPAVRRNRDGEVEQVVFSGRDITHAVETEESVQRLATENERSRRAIDELKQQVDELKAIASGEVGRTNRGPADRLPGLPWLHDVRPFEKTPHDPVGHERRSSPRRAYPYFQRIAPFQSGRTPAADQFRKVPFRDISSGGISFLLRCKPDFQRLVIELGRGGRLAYLAAEIVWVRQVQEGDATSFLVGCKFTGRVEPPSDMG
jgi:PAS domain S-box-containing protein